MASPEWGRQEKHVIDSPARGTQRRNQIVVTISDKSLFTEDFLGFVFGVLYKFRHTIEIVAGEIVYVNPPFVVVADCGNFRAENALHALYQIAEFEARIRLFFRLGFRLFAVEFSDKGF